MAVKSKKITKKIPKKKVLPLKANAKSVDSEVLGDASDMMSPGAVEDFLIVMEVVEVAEKMKAEDLISGIKTYSDLALKHARLSVKLGASALVFAWATGKLLNAAKSRFGRGSFGTWRNENLDLGAISERTLQRYMLLAKNYPDVKALLHWNPGLRQAYVACGILPEPERTVGEVDDEPAPKTQALLTSLSSLQKNLRLFTGSGEKLVKADLTQLKLMRDELNRFFDQVIPSIK